MKPKIIGELGKSREIPHPVVEIVDGDGRVMFHWTLNYDQYVRLVEERE